ncbi:MAG TPA: serine hydrolase [Solirubrobacteraceae bacterium]|nr:serine hydrolase [Solirubrobacteraceae bacterium]
MSSPPPIIPADSRGRAPFWWRVLLALAALALLGGAALAAALGAFAGAHHTSVSARRGPQRRPVPAAAARARPPAAPARSPDGLVLGRAPLILHGLGTPHGDPVQVSFHRPPRAGLLFNLESGRVLWQRNPERRMRIASLNKMMTALLVVRSARPDARVLVTREAVDAPGSKVGVLPRGRHVPLESMLYGLMLPSGNDAAVALAQYLAGSVSAFVASMNAEAAHLGLACTRYSSPSGFYDEGNFSCAADLAVLAHADLAHPRLARVARTASAVLPFPIKGGKLYLSNNNPLLIYGYPGVTGLKTGYTNAAGRCLVATASRHGVHLGVVLLNSPAPATEARRLLDLGFEQVYHEAPELEPPIPPQA